MPYIRQDRRARMEVAISALEKEIVSAGELNYVLTRLCDQFSHSLDYLGIAVITGVLENVKQEFYRRKAVPYEEKKMVENGDVYK